MTHTRARPVITRGPIRVVGKFPSKKSGRSLHWESQLERDRMFMLEFDPEVLSFKEQPKTYNVIVNGELRRYTPDLEIITRTGTVVEEVKPADKVAQYTELFRAMPDVLADEGKFFSVVTDQDIRREPYLSNIKNILWFRHFKLPTALIDRVMTDVAQLTSPRFGQLKELLSGYGTEPAAPWSFLAHQLLLTDYNSKITDESLINLNHGEWSCQQ